MGAGKGPEPARQQLLPDEVGLLLDEGLHLGTALLQPQLHLQALPGSPALQPILLDAGLLPCYEVLQGRAPLRLRQLDTVGLYLQAVPTCQEEQCAELYGDTSIAVKLRTMQHAAAAATGHRLLNQMELNSNSPHRQQQSVQPAMQWHASAVQCRGCLAGGCQASMEVDKGCLDNVPTA